jgi:hypothetical protein
MAVLHHEALGKILPLARVRRQYAGGEGSDLFVESYSF